MPLLGCEVIGHDPERLIFRFSMLDGLQVVQCQISDAALDELAGTIGTVSSARMGQFLSLRQSIEHTASRIFDERPPRPGSIVRIFSKHINARPDVAGERDQVENTD